MLDVRGTYRFLAEQARGRGARNPPRNAGKRGAQGRRRPHLRRCRHNPGRGGRVPLKSGDRCQRLCLHGSQIHVRGGRGGPGLAPGPSGRPGSRPCSRIRGGSWWAKSTPPQGTHGLFPVNENTARIGVGVGKPESEADPTEILRRLMAEKTGPIGDLGRIEPIEFHYGLIPNDGPVSEDRARQYDTGRRLGRVRPTRWYLRE